MDSTGVKVVELPFIATRGQHVPSNNTHSIGVSLSS
jgi:hypothetical protein